MVPTCKANDCKGSCLDHSSPSSRDKEIMPSSERSMQTKRDGRSSSTEEGGIGSEKYACTCEFKILHVFVKLTSIIVSCMLSNPSLKHFMNNNLHMSITGHRQI